MGLGCIITIFSYVIPMNIDHIKLNEYTFKEVE